jgi:RNA polymerase sigma-70 factor (sigma-E family)
MTTGRNWAGGSREDELLSRLYQQVTQQQAARFAGGYDMAAGLGRYRAWLGGHAAEEPSRPKAIQRQGSTTLRAGAADPGVGIAAVAIDELPGASEATQGFSGTVSGTPAVRADWDADWDADQAVTVLYGVHYRSLVGLAALLVRDVATAEVIVQDSFVALHVRWRWLRDNEKALSYLRQSVVTRSRWALRYPVTADTIAPEDGPGLSAAEPDALPPLERTAVVTALQALPERQRESLLLRYYADLSPAQTASVMGISVGEVKSHTARAMEALRTVLGTSG